jgi:transposase
MRGEKNSQVSMMCLVSPNGFVPKDHPLRRIKRLADDALHSMDDEFTAMYSERGRPSIPPERLLKSILLTALYSIRSDRQLCEQVQYNLLFRWFLDMDMEESSFDASTFSHNRDRLMNHDIASLFLASVVSQARTARLLSAEHMSVDGTLIEAWASVKSFKPKESNDDKAHSDSNGWKDFKGQKRSNKTHQSVTDPESRLMRKGFGKEAKLNFSGHALMENRNGLVLDFCIEEANGKIETEAALNMLRKVSGKTRLTIGADAGYDTKGFVASCRELNITPHVTEFGKFGKGNGRRKSAIDKRTTRHSGYEMSQVVRRRIEEIFGWLKCFGGLRRSRFKGRARTELYGKFAVSALNLIKMAKLMGS